MGNRRLAARHFAAAVAGRQDEPFLLNRLGWLLATSPEDDVRDGARAVEVAERAVRITRRDDATSLDTLAAAYAETGRFDAAVAAAREAITVATRKGPAALLPELNARLVAYQARQPSRESSR
jgi:hypothetical protein